MFTYAIAVGDAGLMGALWLIALIVFIAAGVVWVRERIVSRG